MWNVVMLSRASSVTCLHISHCGRAVDLLLVPAVRDLQPSWWAIPKVRQLLKFAHTIRRLGSTAVVSSSFGESTHALFNKAARHTNNRGDRPAQVQFPAFSTPYNRCKPLSAAPPLDV